MTRTQNPERVGFCSWSGGKDSCLALYKAQLEDEKARVPFLLNMAGTGDEQKNRGPHGLKREVFSVQADSMGRELIQVRTDWDSYERNFKEAVRKMKREEGVEFGVFGDSELAEHREWVEDTCAELEIEARLPLWGQKPAEIYRDFLRAGFQALLVNLQADLFSSKHLGRRLDGELLEFLKEQEIHLTGEGGEYHSLVVDGPLFRRRLRVTEAVKKETESRLQYDILELG